MTWGPAPCTASEGGILVRGDGSDVSSGLARGFEGIALRRKPDADVFARALRGDDVAFSEVYRRYHQRVYGFCLARLLSPEAANDATQEVFTRLLAANPDSVENPTAWLFGVARHVCVDMVRRSTRTDVVAPDGEQLSDVAAPAETETEVTDRETAEAVLLALRRVSPRYRTALILREVHEQPIADIATALDISIPTTYVVLSRARDAFGKAYAQVGDLKPPCRSAVELLYRRTGTGISAPEQAALDEHLESCPRCRREQARADSGSRMHMVLPLLPVAAGSKGLIARAVHSIGSSPWPIETATHALPHFDQPLAKVAAVALATGAVATTAIVGVSTQMNASAPESPPAPSAATVRAGVSTHHEDTTGTRARAADPDAGQRSRSESRTADGSPRTGSGAGPATGSGQTGSGTKTGSGGTAGSGGSGSASASGSGSGGSGTGSSGSGAPPAESGGSSGSGGGGQGSGDSGGTGGSDGSGASDAGTGGSRDASSGAGR